jgi:hypothetical protein
MKNDWKDWLQIFSNIAILIGIILVILEMQQAEILARADLAGASMDNRLEFTLTLVGDNPEGVLSKACLQPEELTEEDKLQLRRIMRARILIAGRVRGIERLASFGGDVETNARQGFGQLFSVPYLRELYLSDRTQVPEGFRASADEAIALYSAEADCSKGFQLMNTL